MPRPRYILKIDHLTRLILNKFLSDRLPVYLVNEYPKSGGTWLAQMLSYCLQLPFYRNQIPKLVPQIQHGHYLYHSQIKNVVILIRDGRDVMVSYYYHCLFLHENAHNYYEVQSTSKALNISDPDDVEKNLPIFIDYCFSRKNHPNFTWVDFCLDWINKEKTIILYEKMLEDTSLELQHALEGLGVSRINSHRIDEAVETYRFSKQAGRQTGLENVNSFLRKGIAGDWKNKFSRESCDIFKFYGGKTLIQLGYEKDDNWGKQ